MAAASPATGEGKRAAQTEDGDPFAIAASRCKPFTKHAYLFAVSEKFVVFLDKFIAAIFIGIVDATRLPPPSSWRAILSCRELRRHGMLLSSKQDKTLQLSGHVDHVPCVVLP